MKLDATSLESVDGGESGTRAWNATALA